MTVARTAQHKSQDRPWFHGVEQIVTKSTTGCSISSTVVLLPRITVIVGVCPDFSYTIPPLNITYGSLHDNIHGSQGHIDDKRPLTAFPRYFNFQSTSMWNIVYLTKTDKHPFNSLFFPDDLGKPASEWLNQSGL